MAEREFTPAEVAQARLAGIPADREGLGGEYPLMLYKPGDNPSHNILDEPLLVQNKHRVATMIVNDVDEELAAMEEGWSRSPDGKEYISPEKTRIAELEAQLAAANAPRRGRPPKDETAPLQDA